MNILFIAYNINLHSRTGDAVHVCELSKNMAALGNKITLIAGYNPNFEKDPETIAGNPNIDLYYLKEPKIKYPRYKDVELLSVCLKLAKKSSPDIIYERNFSCKIGAILKTILGVPLIVEINGVYEEEIRLEKGFLLSKKKIISDWLKKAFYRRAETIITVSPLIKDKLIERYNLEGKDIEVVSNGADTELFCPLDKDTSKTQLKLSQGAKYICFVGNLTAWQGLDSLINAAPLIIEQNPDIRFLIVGDGIMRGELERMTKENNTHEYFIFVGSVPFTDVPLYINSSELCVALFSLNRKCSPLKVFEYLACGRPVIISDLGDDTQLFEKCAAVYFLRSQNPLDISNMVTDVLKKYCSEENSTKSRKFIVENYTWKDTARKVISICNREI